jgi:two-component system, NarL family, invasion response regulator UvrY
MPTDLATLTEAERKIVKLVVEGHSTAEVAAELGLSPRTVETYRLRAMGKLGVENLVALVKWAIRQGITGA